ncbi:hypothetical protein E2I00_009600, partial [Balaenoptera physalus]
AACPTMLLDPPPRLKGSRRGFTGAGRTGGPPVALSLAEKAVCKVVYGAPRPRPLLLPVGLELWLYVGTEDLKTLSAIYSQLGNAYFYLKEYARALEYHKHDLLLARTIGDRMGEAKASGNLGNTLKVLGRFDEAIVCCQRHLDIAQEQGDKVGGGPRPVAPSGSGIGAAGDTTHSPMCSSSGTTVPFRNEGTLAHTDAVGEARALYNIGNVYHAKGKQLSWNAAQDPGHLPPAVRETLRRASEFYEKTLQLSRQLKDQAVEAQACYSLGNTYTLLQDYERAAEYHLRHLLIAQELADRVGEGRACWSLGNAYVSMGSPAQALTFAKKHLEISQELQLALGRLSSPAAAEKPDLAGYEAQGARPKRTQRLSAETWDLLRLPLEREQNGDSHPAGDWRGPGRDLLPLPPSLTASPQTEEFFDLIASSQSRRLDDQRASVGSLPGLRITHNNLGHLRGDGDPQEPGDEFFNMLIKCQSSRIDDQRCPPPDVLPRGPTMPDEDFFSLIQRVQAKRMDEQRVDLAGSPEEVGGPPEPRQQCQPGAS